MSKQHFYFFALVAGARTLKSRGASPSATTYCSIDTACDFRNEVFGQQYLLKDHIAQSTCRDHKM